MGFKTYRGRFLLAMAALLILAFAGTVGTVVWASPVKKKPAVSADAIVFDRIGDDVLLGGRDAERYARIFAYQDVGNLKKADEVIAELEDHRLMGHVLYQRFTGPDYKTSYQELALWMKSYADHPSAQKIYDLARRRKPKKNAISLKAPRPGRSMSGYHDYDSGQLAQPYLAERKHSRQERDIIKAIQRNLSGSPTAALKQLEAPETRKLFNAIEYDSLRAQIAESYFYNDKVKEAYKLASASSNRSGKEVPRAGWIAGLSAWKEGDYEDAAQHFERAASSPRASAWMSSASAYWAARSHLRSRHPQKVSHWLQRAAEHPRSFYGIIAIKALGMEQARFNWDMPRLNNRLAETLAAIPAGRRALALIEAEQPELAEQELRRIDPGSDEAVQEAMMSLAHKAGVPAFEMRLGSGLQDREGNLYDAALYPEAPWHPQGGYQIDKALVYAFIRQESKFNADVVNKSSGAMGLMQLLPSTAMNVARVNGISVEKKQLQDPAVNMLLGQKYLMALLERADVRNNLFKLAVAYNAGPGNLARWEKTVSYEDDPLLFIESIPIGETRIFVERVMTNYWIYRLKYNQNTDSLDEVAAGKWPTYVAEDSRRIFSFASATMLAHP